MSTQFSFDPHTDYLGIKVWGTYPVDNAVSEIIRDEANRLNQSRLLVNSLELDAPPHDLDRFWAGRKVADVFGRRFKIAVLVRFEQGSKFAEHTAVNRGARLLVTSDEATALDWLLK